MSVATAGKFKLENKQAKVNLTGKPSAPVTLTEEMVAPLIEWTEKMVDWGKGVRADIIRLEGNAGFTFGDPEDPPTPPPWGGK
jgi:hypothetical protein